MQIKKKLPAMEGVITTSTQDLNIANTVINMYVSVKQLKIIIQHEY
jgi:hypothetical protein